MKILPASWQVPKQVVAFSTTRAGGVSSEPFCSLNLGLHVNDVPADVVKNRAILSRQLPSEPVWLNQVHSSQVVVIDGSTDLTVSRDADAIYTKQINQPLAIMTADCLPVFISSTQGDEVAVAHAGWRGLLNGVIENTLACFKSSQLCVHLGPAIGPAAFEVGAEVRSAFIDKVTNAESCFTDVADKKGKYFADIYGLARLILKAAGVVQISGGEYCTYHQAESFFSYRRDGITGRNAHIIYITQR